MNHAISYHLTRRFGSFQLSALLLIALLQRTPVLRLLAGAESVWVSSSLGQVLKAAAVVTTMLGAVDTLVGATTLVTTPESPAEATVGVSFAAGFAYTGGATTVGSYSISNLPPGLTVPGSFLSGNVRVLNNAFGTITGTPTQAGDFIVNITAFDDPNLGAGTHGSVLSFFTITVADASSDAPVITTQPTNLTVTTGQSASFTVAATGSPTPTFQWRKNAVNIPGATGATFNIATTNSGDAGTYSVVVTNSVSSVASNGAILTVNVASTTPAFTTQPLSQAVVDGGSVTFTAVASGTPAPVYQWQKNGVDISGAVTSGYTITGATGNDSGSYRVVATNSVGSITSNIVLLTVIIAPSNVIVSFMVE